MSNYVATPGLFGGTNYYNESGDRVGCSWPGVVPGSANYYSSGGELLFSSQRGCTTEMNYYAGNDYAGSTHAGLFGEHVHQDALGAPIGATWETDGFAKIDLDF